LVTEHFSYFVWALPTASLFIILLFVLAAAAAAVYAPVRRIWNMAVTETINELGFSQKTGAVRIGRPLFRLLLTAPQGLLN